MLVISHAGCRRWCPEQGQLVFIYVLYHVAVKRFFIQHIHLESSWINHLQESGPEPAASSVPEPPAPPLPPPPPPLDAEMSAYPMASAPFPPPPPQARINDVFVCFETLLVTHWQEEQMLMMQRMLQEGIMTATVFDIIRILYYLYIIYININYIYVYGFLQMQNAPTT